MVSLYVCVCVFPHCLTHFIERKEFEKPQQEQSVYDIFTTSALYSLDMTL